MIEGYGYKGFEVAVDKFEKKLIREIKRIVAETTEMIVSQAKALAPVNESALKDSIDATYAQGGLTAIIRVGVFYGVYVNYGTGIYSEHPEIPGRLDPWVYYSKDLGRWVFSRGIRAQPFWEPSLEAAMKHFRDEMNKLG